MSATASKRSALLIECAKHVALERESAIAQAHHHLVQMLGHLRAAHHYNFTHGLGLELPTQAEIIELVGICVQMSQSTETNR